MSLFKRFAVALGFALPDPRGYTTKPVHTFDTTIAGVGHGDRAKLVKKLETGDPLMLVREPDNPHDENAIQVLNNAGRLLGYIPAHIAEDLASELNSSHKDVAAQVARPVPPDRERKYPNAVVRISIYRFG